MTWKWLDASGTINFLMLYKHFSPRTKSQWVENKIHGITSSWNDRLSNQMLEMEGSALQQSTVSWTLGSWSIAIITTEKKLGEESRLAARVSPKLFRSKMLHRNLKYLTTVITTTLRYITIQFPPSLTLCNKWKLYLQYVIVDTTSFKSDS